MIRIKRAYEPSAPEDGARFLVDRFWPRGRSKESLALTGWKKEAAPSDGLRRWFGHDLRKWDAFLARYATELDKKPEVWRPLLETAQKGTITLVFGAKDLDHNNAAALQIYLDRKLARHRR